MKNFFDKLYFYIILFGVIGLIMGIINAIKGEAELAKTGFIFFGVAVVVFLFSTAFSKISEKRRDDRPQPQPPVPANVPAAAPLTVLGMAVLLEYPLRSGNDRTALIQSIFEQQCKEFKRVIAPSAQVQIIVAGASIDDEAYIYGICRSTFDSLDSYANNEEFLQRVATGSFTASDGNHGKHYAFLNRRL